MADRIFDLYLDESGSFEKKGEHTLIGGVMIPHEQNPSLQDFRTWEADIRSAIAGSGEYEQKDLLAGDEWHDLFIKSKRKPGLTAQESQRFAELENTKRYVFAHCSENGKTPARWKTQGWVLREYLKRLSAVSGVPVLFDNPDGVYYIDSNTTFMSIFAGGVVKLYDDLMKKYPKDEIILNIHAASRLNVTRKYEKDQYEVSPLAGKEANLERNLYINQINNYVFLNGGFELLDLKGFKSSMDSFDILLDLNDAGKPVPNPSTVICDYICNGAWTDNPGRKYIETMKEYGLISILSFGQNPDLSENKMNRMAQDHDWITFLKTLISRGFPEKETEEFFARMGQDRYDQQLCVNGLVDYLLPFVDNRETMPLWIKRLDQIMESCRPFKPEAYLSLEANLLVFKHSLQTHLGQDVAATQKAFTECIRQIRPVEQRDYLLSLYCNRQIVTETDCFRFDKGHEWFDAANHYFSKQMENSNELMTWFSLLSDVEETPACSVQYGKTLGSFIQLLTKEYRNASPDRKAELKAQAEEAIDLAFKQLTEEDYRAHQNACDFYAETGNYDLAMEHLALSFVKENAGDTFESRASAVLGKCGRFGELAGFSGKFAYLHYVSMMHRCFRVNDPHGELMLDLVLANSINMDSMNHMIGNQYPDAVILRHLAASLAQRQGKRTIAQVLFDCANKALMNHGELFRTISMSVRAEMIALGLEQKLPGTQADWQKKAEHYFRRSFPLYAQEVKYNPFPAIPEQIPQSDQVAFLYQLADTVVY